MTHPAFTFGNDEIDGFWVGKFLTGYAGATTTDEARVNVIDPSKVLVKPSTYYWNDIAIYNAYQNTIKLRDASNVLGMDSTDDPHMMKNMEWGAVVYLTSSKYGKQGNPNYVGVDKQVRVNNNSAYITGCGADTYNGEQVATCNTYETVNGQAASTTGNITGIYDMAGKWQYVMAGVVNSSGVPQLAKSLFPKEELVAIVNEGKYIDTYVFGNSILSVVKQGRLGDATKELAPSTSWYDTTLDPLRSFSGIFMYWSNRGGGRSGQLYSASGITGQNLPGFGFRVTLAIGTNTSSGI